MLSCGVAVAFEGLNYVVHTSTFILVWSSNKDPLFQYELYHFDA